MKNLPKAALFLFICFIFQGAGYVGTPPNLNDYFQAEREESQSEGFLNIQKEKLTPPPKLDTKLLQKQLAPSDYSNLQLQVLRPAKKPAYYNDLLDLKTTVESLQQATKTSEVQNFCACVNIQKFYLEGFLDKYKNSPQAKQDIYPAVKDIIVYSQAVANQWYTAVDNIQYVSYNSYNGAYQPATIRAKVNVLDKKLTNLKKMIESAELSF